MPKTQHKCDLCSKPLRNLTDAKRVHDRTCPGFKALHIQSVSHIHQRLALQSNPTSALGPPVEVEMQVDEVPPVLPEPPEPEFRPSGLPNRRRHAPARLNDAAPAPPPRIRRRRGEDAPPALFMAPSSSTAPSSSIAPLPTAEPEPKPLQTYIQTEPNEFGLYKVYPRRPTHDPDAHINIRDLYQVPLATQGGVDSLTPQEPWYYPFPNASVAHMMKYHIEEESAGSIAGFDRLIHNILRPNPEAESDGVNLHDLPLPFSTKKFLDDLDKRGIEPLGVNEKWLRGCVSLKLPCAGRKQKEMDAPEFTLTDIYYRPLLDPIREVLQGPLFQQFHTTPFSLRFDPTSGLSEPTTPNIPLVDMNAPLDKCGLPDLLPDHEEVFGELYTSAAMLEAYHAIPQPPPPQSPEDPVESIIVAIMEWSDATHLAQFGTASLWPGYTFFGNHPKGFRGKPSANAGFHQAYFPTLPDSIRDQYREKFGQDMADDVYRHLKRELMHRIWELLLSEEFMDAYDNGIKIKCWDGIVRLIFPRFFIYGADYPEKVLLATIRSLGGHPCPRCFIAKSQISETGTVNDMKRRQVLWVDDHHRREIIEDARKAIFDNGFAVAGSSIDNMLKPNSWVPVRNAFSKLNTEKTPFNFYSLFVPDLLHEVELGVVKAITIHLIRMLQTFKNIDEFDARFRQIEPFGRSGIRAFGHNVSEMKYAAARNFEDVLQCILPVLEGLFPMHQKLVDQLCFELAVWHGYAKLRMHTTTTVKLFRTATRDLLTSIRRFSRETANVKTYELPREERRRLKKASKAPSTSAALPTEPPASVPNPPLPPPSSVQTKNTKGKSKSRAQPPQPVSSNATADLPTELPVPSGSLPKAPAKKTKQQKEMVEKPFNLITYKLHALPDYPDAIVRFGTTDSTSTQIGELAHRLVKYLYSRTNKRDHVHQIAKHEHRRRLIRAMWERRRHYKKLENKAVAGAEAAAMTTNTNSSTEKGKQPDNRRKRLTSALHPQKTHWGQVYVPPEQHHYISDSKRSFWRLSDLVDTEISDADSDSDSGADGPRLERMDIDRASVPDPALKDFVRKLKSHLRHRLCDSNADQVEFTQQDLMNVVIEKDLLYTHATMHVNYTTYDVRRDQDVLNPRTRRFFLVHAQDPVDSHRYWYGEILGIFHAYVLLADVPGKSQRLEFLWVRWFQRDMTYKCGFKVKRFPRLQYMPHQSPDAFNFLDPRDVVRGSHLIPAFNHGHTNEYLPPKSFGRRMGDKDWLFYYVNLVADRDMLMRYHDNVVGHRKIVPVQAELSGDRNQGEQAEDDTAQENHAPNATELMNQDTPTHLQDGGVPLTSSVVEEAVTDDSAMMMNEEQEGIEDPDWCGVSSSSGSESDSEEAIEGEEVWGDDAIRNQLQLAE